MLKYYLILGLSFPATEEEIRSAYLNLVKRFPPERFPKEFPAITEAYEALKDKTHRIRTAFQGCLYESYPEEDILALAGLTRYRSGQMGLRDLIKGEGKGKG